MLVPFQLAFVATYALFFAEPRYRLPIEMLAFPFVAFALGRDRRPRRAAAVAIARGLVHAAKALGPALVVVVVWRVGWPAMLDAGTGPARAPRWAVSEAERGRTPRLLLWAPAPPLAAQSPLAGSPEGVHVRTDGGRPADALRLRLGGGPLPPARYALQFGWKPRPAAARHARGRGRRRRPGAPARRRRDRTTRRTADTVRHHLRSRRADRSGSATRRINPCI
jgi:hypothetical protein